MGRGYAPADGERIVAPVRVMSDPDRTVARVRVAGVAVGERREGRAWAPSR
jgi:hypothetical protein